MQFLFLLFWVKLVQNIFEQLLLPCPPLLPVRSILILNVYCQLRVKVLLSPRPQLKNLSKSNTSWNTNHVNTNKPHGIKGKHVKSSTTPLSQHHFPIPVIVLNLSKSYPWLTDCLVCLKTMYIFNWPSLWLWIWHYVTLSPRLVLFICYPFQWSWNSPMQDWHKSISIAELLVSVHDGVIRDLDHRVINAWNRVKRLRGKGRQQLC